MKEYEINEETLAIINVSSSKTKVIEENNEYIVDKNGYKIMDESCQYFGSSYQGRVVGSKKILNANYKLPIIVEESRKIIFFPTTSPKMEDCMWISLNKIDNYIKHPDKTTIIFKNGKKIDINISSSSINNQILRSSRLDSILSSRIY